MKLGTKQSLQNLIQELLQLAIIYQIVDRTFNINELVKELSSERLSERLAERVAQTVEEVTGIRILPRWFLTSKSYSDFIKFKNTFVDNVSGSRGNVVTNFNTSVLKLVVNSICLKMQQMNLSVLTDKHLNYVKKLFLYRNF